MTPIVRILQPSAICFMTLSRMLLSALADGRLIVIFPGLQAPASSIRRSKLVWILGDGCSNVSQNRQSKPVVLFLMTSSSCIMSLSSRRSRKIGIDSRSARHLVIAYTTRSRDNGWDQALHSVLRCEDEILIEQWLSVKRVLNHSKKTWVM